MTDLEEVYCSSCSARIPEDTSYCSECGAEQAHVVRSDSVERSEGTHLPLDKEYCSHCGEVIPADVLFCPDCGANQGQEDDEHEDGRSKWIIGFKPNSTRRNRGIALLYFLFYPIGIPLLIYGYLNGKREWSNRKIGIGVASVALALMISLVGIGLLVDVPEESPQSSVPSAASATEEYGDTGGSSEQSLDVAVRVEYGGEWAGAVSILYDGESNSRSISGTGTTTISIDGDPSTISVNSQKQDGSSSTLIVQIIEDGEVISEARTSSAYGVAQTSSDIDDFI